METTPGWRYTWQRMAWRFRKSIKFGPLKLNLSKSGVGYSIGGRGFRVGKDAKGRSYTAASIPGTGLYRRTYSSDGSAEGESAAPTPAPGSSPARSAGAARGFLYLLIAFVCGALAVYIFTPKPAPLPIAPPAAVSMPIPPPPPAPAKRKRVHHSKRTNAPALQNHASQAPQPQAAS